MTTAHAPLFTSALDPAPAPAVDDRSAAGVPRTVLRVEGAVALAAATVAYAHVGLGWGWFAALFLVPDLSLLGYLVDRRVGAIAYNAGHSTVGPALLAAVALVTGRAGLLPVALIWVAHIGFDRMLGYGLKYATAFGATHLGRVGRRAA
jgi:hypothetical protein